MAITTELRDELLEENITPAYERLSFFGSGSTYFGIVVLNVVLTIFTLGLYYPWAKAAYRKYIWNETEFKGSRFVFNGTGKEMFKGFLIAYAVFISFYIGISFLSSALVSTFGLIFILLFYVLILFLIPFAIYGAWRYRISRTSWRGIFFRFDGNFKEFLLLFIAQTILTIFTLGIYGSWRRVKIQQYLFSHTHIGNLSLDFYGKGETLFGINILGIIVSPLTLYLYLPIWIKERFNFTINNTAISDGERQAFLESDLQPSTAFGIIVSNFLLLIVTAGIAFPWTFCRKMKMYFEHILIPGDFDFDGLVQTDEDYRDATGDEMSDIFDIGIDF